jgi:heptosyltransferase-1
MNGILILKRSSFGDIVHTSAVIPPLRRSFPDAKITWVCGAGFGPFLSAVEGIDEVVEAGLRASGIGSYLKALRSLRARHFDVLIDFQGTLKSWLLVLRAKAARKIGFNRADAREPLITRFYNETIPPLEAGLHVIRQYYELLRPLGVKVDRIGFPSFNIRREDSELIDEWFRANGLGVDVVVNPFTNWKTKSWPSEHAASLCRLLSSELGIRPLLLWGPGEKAAAEEIARAADGAAVIGPASGLTQLVALLRRTRLYIGGDTGPTQLAAALGVPLVALFGPTDPWRNGPLAPDDIIIREDLDCDGCKRNRCSRGTRPECMQRITPEIVLRAVIERLGEKP